MNSLTLVLGTHNRKKRAELEELLGPHGFRLRLLDEILDPVPIEVEETGQAFAENAALKAQQQARHLQQWVIGEDSGLSVDALGGAPGIYSARYAGENATDEENNAKLLAALADVPDAKRGAHYVCHMALSDPQGTIQIRCEATCNGRIARETRGNNGFGYDPLFLVPEYHRTFGELGPSVKAALSHRSRCMRRFVPQLRKLAAELAESPQEERS
jgi:XTP/dITP diphosphohydrolase